MSPTNANPSRLAARISAGCAASVLACAGVAQASNDSMGQWREYARQGVMPEYSWNATRKVEAPTLLSTMRASQVERARASIGSPLNALSFNVSSAPVGASSTPVAPLGLIARDRSTIESQFVGSTYGRNIGTNGRLEVTAVVAHQRYASPGLGTANWIAREELVGLRDETPEERSTGHGVRVSYGAPLGRTLAWNVMVQSRLDMDAFESYRGIYTEAGDFDLPARMQAQLEWAVTPDFALGFGIERVLFSEIPAFTSAALPTRFLSLLGDGSSPEFAWRDLTVYSIEGAVFDPTGAEWSLRYSTRQQPSPTSALLERAMRREFTDLNLALGYRRSFGSIGQLALAASYSPSHYFLGASPYSLRDFDGGSQMEFEALWSVPF